MIVEPTEAEVCAQLIDYNVNPPRQRTRKAAESIARSIANRNGPRLSENDRPKQNEDLFMNPQPAAGNRYPGGPVRILKMDGKLTERGKEVERELLAKIAAAENAAEKAIETGEQEEDPSTSNSAAQQGAKNI